MPYLPEDDRIRLLETLLPKNEGELNFLITILALRYWSFSDKRYKDINSIIGAMDCAKLEFYRRVAVPYENQKIKQNGDVYDSEN